MTAYPPFPPRTVPTFCAVAGDAPGGKHWPRVSTVEESSLRRERAIQWLRSQACRCNCTVEGSGTAMIVNKNRVFPRGLSHVRGLCGPHGRRIDVMLRTGESAGGSNNLIVHGSAAEAGAADPSTDFAVVARIGLERAGYQFSRVPGTLLGRALPCVPAEANGGQRCPAMQEACDLLITTLKTTLELQGIPGWPQLYGLGCCEYRLNATHAAPLLVDVRQPLQTSAMWSRRHAVRSSKSRATHGHEPGHGHGVRHGHGPALSACLEARPPLSLEQCALRAALLSAELLRGLTEERMISLNEHVFVPDNPRRRRLREMLPPVGRRASTSKTISTTRTSTTRTSASRTPTTTRTSTTRTSATRTSATRTSATRTSAKAAPRKPRGAIQPPGGKTHEAVLLGMPGGLRVKPTPGPKPKVQP